ncbi:MAG: hypothetical protein HYS86_00100 [Candidatus Chisholmbacteria bacterium]|nr:hypothetical protein [Candidatus Chisholmbacteria bacterium]
MADEEQKESGSMSGTLVGVALALLLLGGGGTYYFYNQYQQTQRALTEAQANSQEAQAAEVESLVGQVGELMELPQGETPTVATIRSTENLAEHPFLSRGQVGDRLLIYTGDSRLVVMYRPGTDKIVAVGSVTIQEAAESGQTAGAATEEEASPEPEPEAEE